MSVIVKLLSKFDDSGIRKAKSGFSGLKGAIGAIGLGVGIKEVADLFMDSAKAASADAKSIKLMNLQLARNANATKGTLKQNNKFIESLSLQTGILDDDLRPSLSKFANVTHNVGKAQKLLKVQLDVVAGSGKSSTKVANALAKAYAGNTKSLIGMFPELKNSKDALGDLTKEFSGAALVNADPFMKFNNSMDILKEKLGAVVLPLITNFVDEISKPGGLVEQVGKFLDDMKDPKTEAGKMFTNIKDAVTDAFNHVKDFFALFGNGNAVEGFKNIAKALVIALPALIALKGIMFLSQTGKSLVNLVAAIAALRGTGGGGLPVTGTPGGKLGNKFPLLGTGALLGLGLVLSTSGDTKQQTPEEYQRFLMRQKGINPDTGMPYKLATGESGIFTSGKVPTTQTNNVTINVQSADPKAVVDALGKYVKTNGALPKSITNAYGR